MADTQNKTDNPKDGLALIVGGLFILALVFATYNYFNKSNKISDVKKIEEESVFQEENSTENNKEEAKGDLNGNGAKTQNLQGSAAASTKTGGETAALGSSTSSTNQTSYDGTKWVANDYKNGDIKGASYTVKSGDTLWEIAEGAYGNGADWTKILEANKGSIDFLPNGSQALIRPGQVLVLP